MFYAMIIFLAISIIEMLFLSGFGLYSLFIWCGNTGAIITLAIVLVTLSITGLLVWRFIEVIKKELVKTIANAKKWLKSLSVKDIIKLVMGFIKK